jgi:outer membrane protein TolC
MNWRILLVFLTFLSVNVEASLPPFAQTYLGEIPEKKLTLPFVVKTALLNADAYRIIGLQFNEAELERLSLSAETDTIFSSGANYSDDNSVKSSAFSPERFKKWDWNLGFSKKWASGTKTSLGWVHEWNSGQYALSSGPISFASAFVPEYKQTMATINIEQSLLKDSFGYSYRHRIKAAKKRGEALKWQTQSDLEDTTLQFIGEFYSAWLLQQQVSSLKDQVRRQEKLLRVMRRKNRKGAVEKPELIQVEALLASTKTKYALARSELITQWEKLVFSLKMPMEFLQVNPMDIPTQIDEPTELSLRICGHKDPKKTAQIKGLEKSLEAAQADFSASKNSSLPDLKLIAGYRGNSIDGSGSQTAQEVLNGSKGPDNTNIGLGPTWNIGLSLAWPLDNSLAHADRTKRYLAKEKLVSQLQIQNDNLKSQWLEVCRKLSVEKNNEKNYKNVVNRQKKRVSAENRRFSLGRITVDQLVTAEDDLGRWEFLSQQKSIEVRQLAWTVQKISGELYSRILPAIEARMKETQE